MKPGQTAKARKVLVVDIGGTNVKLLATGQKEPRKYPSGPGMTAQKMVQISGISRMRPRILMG